MSKSDNKNYRRLFITIMVLWFIGIIVWYLHAKNFAVLNPKGPVASKQHALMMTTLWLSLLVVVPVFVMLFGFAWRYREGNHHAKYAPNLSGNWILESIWWGIPTAIILALSVITWNTSHALDPRRPLSDTGQPLVVQVVALQWKWLFIYPQQGVATVNYLELPVGQPVKFEVTADAPMNSFWIPQLGGQIYAMPGMSTTLNLEASMPGDYYGSSANISGRGFADMHFTAHADSPSDFDDWMQAARLSGQTLDYSGYAQLAKPSDDTSVKSYSAVESGLYNHVLLKFMAPGSS